MGRPLLILLDTHVVAWLAFDATRVSKKARTAIDEARNSARGIAISGISLFELARLSAKQRVEIPLSPESFLSEVERRFVVIPISGRICLQTLSLPPSYPKDPADRIIGATALVEGFTLVTADRQIRNSGAVTVIW